MINLTVAPVIADLKISGTLNVGQSLAASYTFDANSAPLDKSTYAWGYKGATEATVGSGSVVTTSGTVPAYKIVAREGLKYPPIFDALFA